MAETLLALLLVTKSAKGSSLVYRWPPSPTASPRLSRPKINDSNWHSQLDNPWRASHYPDMPSDDVLNGDTEYWQQPGGMQTKSAAQGPHSSFHRKEDTYPSSEHEHPHLYEYDHLFGYSAEFIAGLLSPHKTMNHQKFELVVDNLAFLGHPVCADADGSWRFKLEKPRNDARGRESRETRGSDSPYTNSRGSLSPESASQDASPSPSASSSGLHIFHFVMVLDLPDPSSSASGNVQKYFDIIYEQIAFTVTAVLYQEQVLSNFVEAECDLLGSLKDSCTSKGEPFSSYVSQALDVSSIAPAMKAIYEAIKNSSIAYITIHDLPLELQLPPYLDTLLHSEGDNGFDFVEHPEDDEYQSWGQEMTLGWRLPTLAPWKSLLLLDGHPEVDSYMNLRGPHTSADDRTLAEGLIRFLETASVTLSLSDMASLLDWDLEAQVYPTVRWLVLHRRAKVVDTVHSGLKTVFMLPPKLGTSLSQLSLDFERQFSHHAIPPLPQIIATVSTAMSKQTDNHFFASVVKSKELIPMFHDVVLWMLKRDLLITLHLRIRIVATREVKLRVHLEREKVLARKFHSPHIRRRRGSQHESSRIDDSEMSKSSRNRSGIAWLSLSPKTARKHTRRLPSNESVHSEISELVISEEEEEVLSGNGQDGSSDMESELESGDSEWQDSKDNSIPSMINDPGRATAIQRRWLAAMSEGKEPHIARRFELINQYFDGKRSDDEILFRAEISRKQLREVLHHYEEYLQTFLHPS